MHTSSARKPSPQTSRRPQAANHRRFRYRFDSGKAPKIVRWSRFQGLLFAPVFEAKLGFGLRIAGFGLRDSGHGIRVTGCNSGCRRAAQKQHCRNPACAMPFTRPKPASALPAIPSRCPRPETIACFRYRFDSNKARQTVRWSRFRGLLFAPVFAANPEAMAAPRAHERATWLAAETVPVWHNRQDTCADTFANSGQSPSELATQLVATLF